MVIDARLRVAMMAWRGKEGDFSFLFSSFLWWLGVVERSSSRRRNL
jgi:hypothetical protein